MKMKNILAIFGLLLIGAGLVAAIGSAAVTLPGIERGRWTGYSPNSSDSYTTQGGNITGLNIVGTTLTDKWADFYGNVTGTIVLADAQYSTNNNAVYVWNNYNATAGTVCLTKDQVFDWATTSLTGTTKDQVDTNMGFTPSNADSATNTYTDNSQNVFLVDWNNINTTGTCLSNAATTPSGLSTFCNGVLDDNFAHSLAYCAAINATGLNYNGEQANYEVMVPTTVQTAGSIPYPTTTTYWFFAELR